jgi:hypothetical protein
VRQPLTHLASAVAYDDDNLLDSALKKITDTRFDNQTFAERKQRLECTHAPRASGG